MQVGIKDFARRVAIEHTNEHGYYTFYDYCIAIGCKKHLAVTFFSIKPNPALTALYEMLGRLVLFLDGRKRIAKIYDHGVTVHPVIYL